MKTLRFIVIFSVVIALAWPATAQRGIQITPKESPAAEKESQSDAGRTSSKDSLEIKQKQPQRPESAVRAVSEIGRDGRFIAYDNGTVLDTKTNLMWAAKDNGSNINWENANNYCLSYRGGGYADWRMPSQEELASLYDEALINTSTPAAGCSGGYHLTNLIHLTCCCSWAAETRGSAAAYFGFGNGPRSWLDQSFVGGIRALPVRSHHR